MWLSASFVHPPAEPVPIRLKPDGDELLLQHAATGNAVGRWPFSELFRSEDSTEAKYILQCASHEAQVEITDINALQSVEWVWRLPGQKAKDPRQTVAWTFGGTAAVAIGLMVVAYLLLAHLPSKLETVFFRNLRVFPDKLFCRSEEGNKSLLLILEKLDAPMSGQEPIRASIFKSDAIDTFVFPAGRIFISSGFLKLAASPDEIAAVLAHQIEHSRQGHVLKALTRDGVFTPYLQIFSTRLKTGALDPSLVHLFSRLSYTAEEETLVRQFAAARLAKASFAPDGLQQFFVRSKARGEFPSFYTDHRFADLSSAPPSSQIENLNTDWLYLQKICD